MDTYDNPAGRLYVLLSDLSEVSTSTIFVSAWSGVLQVAEEDVLSALANVVQLIPDLADAVDTVGDEAFVRLVRRYRSSWQDSVFPLTQPLRAQLSNVGLPAAESMEALDAIASHLHREAPEGPVPSAESISALQEQLEALGVEVMASDLPDEVKRLVQSRLRDIREALNHVSTKGPAAVRYAIEALVGTTLVTQAPIQHRAPVWRTMFAVLATTYALFSSGPVVQASLTAWPQVEQMMLGSGSDQPHTQADEGPARPSAEDSDGTAKPPAENDEGPAKPSAEDDEGSSNPSGADVDPR